MDEALDYESNMYSKLRFEATDSEPAVEFHSPRIGTDCAKYFISDAAVRANRYYLTLRNL